MSNDNTRINLKHYIGQPFSNGAFAAISASVLIFGGGIGAGIGLHNTLDESPDADGTALQETAYQEALGTINALDLQQTQLEIAQKQHDLDVLNGTLTGDAVDDAERDLRKMNEDFAFDSHRTLVGLFNAGELGQEADISEQQFVELTQAFEEKIGAVEGTGLKINTGNAAYLDEARRDIGQDGDITGNPVIDAQTLSDKMAGLNENSQVFSLLGGLGTMVAMFFVVIGAFGKLEDWSYESKRVERRRPKKSKGINH